jgi:cell division septation protein DedD
MMSPNDPTWNDTGFDDGDSGFMPSPGSGNNPNDQQPENDRRRRGFVWLLILTVLAGMMVGGVAYWWFVLRIPSEVEAFVTAASPQHPVDQPTAPISGPQQERPPIVDTPLVVQQERDIARVEATQDQTRQVTTKRSVASQLSSPSTEELKRPARSASGATTPPVAQDHSEADPTSMQTPKPALAPSLDSRSDLKSKPLHAHKPESTLAPRSSGIERNPAPIGGALYVVQVHSTPSRDDAEEWLETLREKNIRDAFVVAQEIKGQTWYRVRFGAFAKREAAEEAAISLGIAQPWIARIR